jgi:hypothetical protein
MRLLKLDNGGCYILELFQKDKVPPYAILSHTWGRRDDDEVTYQEIMDGTGGNKLGFKKLDFCAQQAKHDDLTTSRWTPAVSIGPITIKMSLRRQ